MYRLRRVCSRDIDFNEAVAELRTRSVNSGYDTQLVDSILSNANTLQRVLSRQNNESNVPQPHKVRWVVLSGTPYANKIDKFAAKLNNTLVNHGIRFEIVRCTGASIG